MDCRISNPSNKIAAFDLDHTLLKPKNNKKFPKNKDDAELCYKNILYKLNKLIENEYKIVIFTNQKNYKRLKKDDILYRIDTHLPINAKIDIYISFKMDKYRKPLLGMYDEMLNNNYELKHIFYVGDSAGRDKDFSANDIKFAYNAGINFYTPEQFFLNQKINISSLKTLSKPEHKLIRKKIPEKTVIIIIGMPVSGKSYLAQKLYDKYQDVDIINGNKKISNRKLFSQFIKAIKADCPRIIIDNDNPILLNRIQYIEYAKNYGYKVYAIKMGLDYNYAYYLNFYRCYTENKKLIPESDFKNFFKKYEPIHLNECYDFTTEYIPKLNKNIFKYCF